MTVVVVFHGQLSQRISNGPYLLVLRYFGTKHQGLLFSVIKLKYKLYNLSLQAQRMVLLEIIFSVLCCGY